MSQPAPPSYDPNVNPKAAAKAAKAYAKANRPWYKKKRWWLLGIIALIIIISVATNSGGNSGPSVVSDSGSGSSGAGQGSNSGSSGSAKAGSQENPAKLGQAVELAGTRYTVKKARTAKKIGDPSMLGAKANGTFVIVTLTIENMKNETKTFSQDATKFVAPSGSKYSPDDNGTTAAMGAGNQQPLWFADMQPQLPKTGTIVFDVPPSALKGGLLEVSDLFGSGSAYIDLGVK